MFNDYKQVVIVRRDLNMGMGKLAAQVAHASGMFMRKWLMKNSSMVIGDSVRVSGGVPLDIYQGWFNGGIAKTVCGAKNEYQLRKVKVIADELGLKEGEDYWFINDACRTELTPENFNPISGFGFTTTCVGFKPLPVEVANKISYKYSLLQ